ncbi:MAG TPA: transcriptional regulator [Streptosporangiaceae bacterium]|nr:transcriptional regulator [Streptosporangiaceae bacterium]
MSLSENAADLASVSCLDDQVRGRLYAFVSAGTEPVGRDEAAAAVGIGRALAVYHLDKLVGAGLLTASYRRPPGRGGPGAGRPAKVYTRSQSEFMVTVPAREYELAARLLAQAVAGDRDGQVTAALHVAARKLGSDLGRRQAGPGHDGDQRRIPGQTVERALAERGYEPWHDDSGILRLRNCPFRRLAALHPEVVCQMNLALIQGLVAGVAAGNMSPVLDPRPEYCCVAIPAASSDAATHNLDGTP